MYAFSYDPPIRVFFCRDCGNSGMHSSNHDSFTWMLPISFMCFSIPCSSWLRKDQNEMLAKQKNKKILQNTWNSNCLLLSPLPPYHLQNIPPPEQGPENWFALSRGRPGLHRLAASSTAGNPAVTARLEMEPSRQVENIYHTNQKNPLEDSGQLPYVYIYIYKLYTWYLRVGPKICTQRCVAALLAFSLGDGGPSWWSGSPPRWVERFWWDFFHLKDPKKNHWGFKIALYIYMNLLDMCCLLWL